jgi:hypothetical protein
MSTDLMDGEENIYHLRGRPLFIPPSRRNFSQFPVGLRRGAWAWVAYGHDVFPKVSGYDM